MEETITMLEAFLFLALWFVSGVIGNLIGSLANNHHLFRRLSVTRAELTHPLLIGGPITLVKAVMIAYVLWRERCAEHARRAALKKTKKGVDIHA